jgi:hypothetical protein
MTKMKWGYKRVYLLGGGEEGLTWTLSLAVCEKTKIFSGAFAISGQRNKQRKQVRCRDRDFFKARLGKRYISDKVLHHSWIKNSAEYTKVVLLDKSEHPNGGIDAPRDRKVWITKENWLQIGKRNK